MCCKWPNITRSHPDDESKFIHTLLVFFINDLPNISDNFTSLLSADETTLNFKCASIEECNILCNAEIDKFYKWTAPNKLSVNFGKKKSYCFIHTYRTLNFNDLKIELNNNLLENTDAGMFMGVIIDSKLKYESHIGYIAKKISESIGVLFTLSTLKVAPKV